jgi:hypothetical protein
MIKYKNIIKTLALTVSVGVVSSCESFEELAKNPNAITTPVTSALLTNALNDFDTPSATIAGNPAGLFCQYIAETQYTDASLYATPQIAWDGAYAGSLNDLQNIININTGADTKAYAALNGSNNNQIAVARILKAYRFWNLTDVYGDIPYSEALQKKLNPKYDTQQEVYNGIFKELKEATAQMDGGNGNPFTGDILYHGDMAKWKKFANSIRVLMALRLSKVDPATGKTQLLDALASPGGVFMSNDDNATIVYPGGTYKHPWFITYDGRKDYAISETIGDILVDSKDQRAAAFGQLNGKGELVAFPYGLTRDEAVAFANGHSDFSFVFDKSMREQSSASYVITAAHVYLARAEAAQLGWSTENAEAMYKKGIETSWEQWGVGDTASLDAFLASEAVSLATDPLKKIQLQRYVAFYPNGIQGWSEWRRTGVPALTATPKATSISKLIPRRYVYGANEPVLNKTSYQAAVSRTPDSQDSRVWWDKQ